MKLMLSEKDREKYKQAQVLSEKEDWDGVLIIMKELLESNPKSAMFRAILANTHDLVGNLELAEREYILAVNMAPTSEKVSLGLFHCFHSQGKKELALKEAKRFTAFVPSEEYDMLIYELSK